MASSAKTTNLFLLEDLDDAKRTGELAESDLNALRAVAGWIRTFVVRPNKGLGRDGTVCPFVPGSLERRTLWLAPERIADREMPEVAELMNGYKRLLLDTRPDDGDEVTYNVIVVVFTDLPADRARAVFDEVLNHLAVPSYTEDGILFGPYYRGNGATAIHNPRFRPFESPVPFLFVRPGVTGDWEFFLDDDEWLKLWGRRYGESAVHALAEELRRLRWRSAGHGQVERRPRSLISTIAALDETRQAVRQLGQRPLRRGRAEALRRAPHHRQRDVGRWTSFPNAAVLRVAPSGGCPRSETQIPTKRSGVCLDKPSRASCSPTGCGPMVRALTRSWARCGRRVTR